MKNNIFSKWIVDAINYKKERIRIAQVKEQNRTARRLKMEMMLIQAAQQRRDLQREEELKQWAMQRIEWDDTVDFLRHLEQSREFDR